MGHPGSVAMVAHDGERVYLVRQPREPVDEQQVLELPAGKLDADGEGPLDTAKRELAEEIGKSAPRVGAPQGALLRVGRLHEREDLDLPRHRTRLHGTIDQAFN